MTNQELRTAAGRPEQSLLPTIGRTVHYCLSETDVDEITRRRTSRGEIVKRINVRVLTQQGPTERAWPLGAQAHIGNPVRVGDVFPMVIVRVWGDEDTSCVNGQVFLDGNDVLWATSVRVGDGPGTYAWPKRA